MKEAYLNNYTNVLIFEDDVVFAEGADNVIFSAINQLKQLPNWDIFYMGCSWFLEDYPALFYSGDLIKICGCRANHATAYTRPVLAKILDILPEKQIDVEKFLSIHEAFDLYSPRFLQPFVRVYGMPTPICFQRAGWSDIKKSQKDYSKVMKDNFYILQKRTKIEHLWNYSYHILRLPYLYIKIHVKYFLGSLKK